MKAGKHNNGYCLLTTATTSAGTCSAVSVISLLRRNAGRSRCRVSVLFFCQTWQVGAHAWVAQALQRRRLRYPPRWRQGWSMLGYFLADRTPAGRSRMNPGRSEGGRAWSITCLTCSLRVIVWFTYAPFRKLSCQTTQSAALHVLIASLQVPLELVLRRILAAAGSGNRRQKRAGNEAGARSHTTLSPLAPLHSVAPPILLAAHVLHQR